MKAVVVDIGEKYAVALNNKGQFIKIKNNGRISVGYEVDMPLQFGFGISSVGRIAAAAAIFIFISGLGFGVYSYNVPYSYIDIDINPSVEITSNMYDRIINIVGINDDGKNLPSLDEYKNREINEGVEGVLKGAIEKGYLKPDSTNEVLLTVSGKNSSKALKIQNTIQAKAKTQLTAAKVDTEVLAENTTLEKRDSARKMGLSPGKLSLIEKAVQANPDLKIEDLKKSSVKELVKSIKAGKKQEKAQNKGDSAQTNNNNNNTTQNDQSMQNKETIQDKEAIRKNGTIRNGEIRIQQKGNSSPQKGNGTIDSGNTDTRGSLDKNVPNSKHDRRETIKEEIKKNKAGSSSSGTEEKGNVTPGTSGGNKDKNSIQDNVTRDKPNAPGGGLGRKRNPDAAKNEEDATIRERRGKNNNGGGIRNKDNGLDEKK